MAGISSIGINDDLTARKSGIPVRSANYEATCGIDEELDTQVTRIFKMMEWEPGVWEMESGEQIMVSCSCAKKIYFPLKQ